MVNRPVSSAFIMIELSRMKTRSFIVLILLAGIVTFSGCLYRMDIEQGNRINAEVIDQLELGMSRRQVEFLLGEPAIVDLYHPDTWHYVYYIRLGDDYSVEKSLMSLEFEDDLLARITGDRNLNAEG